MKIGPEMLEWLTEDEVVHAARMAYRDARRHVTPPKRVKFQAKDGSLWAGTADWTEWLYAAFEARLRVLYVENFGEQPYTGSVPDMGVLMADVEAAGWKA